MLLKFANELKHYREKAEVSLKDLSARTRIDLKFLEKIENGDFTFLPNLYVKAFVKDYAKSLGLNVDDILNKYNSAIKGVDYSKVEEKKHETSETDDKKEQKEKHFGEKHERTSYNNSKESFINENKNLIIFILIGLVLVVLALVFLFKNDKASEIIVKEKPYEQVRKESQQRFIEKPIKKKNNTNSKLKKILSLKLNAVDTTWIKIQSDTNIASEVMLYPGNDVIFNSNKKFILIIGNTGGISLQLNGNDLKIFGKDKQVKYIQIDKDGLKFLKNAPSFKNN